MKIAFFIIFKPIDKTYKIYVSDIKQFLNNHNLKRNWNKIANKSNPKNIATFLIWTLSNKFQMLKNISGQDFRVIIAHYLYNNSKYNFQYKRFIKMFFKENGNA